jgi:hypothetical protein
VGREDVVWGVSGRRFEGRRSGLKRDADASKEGVEALLENANTKTFCMHGEKVGIPLLALETLDGIGQIFGSLVIEEDASLILYDCFQGAPSAIGDGGAACGGYFQGRHAEVFFSREEQGVATGDEVLDVGVGSATQEGNGWAGYGFQGFAIGPVADDD